MVKTRWCRVVPDSSGHLQTFHESSQRRLDTYHRGGDQRKERKALQEYHELRKRKKRVNRVVNDLCANVVERLNSNDGRELTAPEHFGVVKGGIKVHLNSSTTLLLNSTEKMIEYADRPENLPSSAGFLLFIALCVEMVQKEVQKEEEGPTMESHAYLDSSEKTRRDRWEAGILLLTRMMNSLGVVGLMLFYSYSIFDHVLEVATTHDVTTREAIAEKAADILRHTLPEFWQDDVQLFYLPYAIEEILEFQVSHAKICESLGLENFSNAPINSPFVKFEQLEPGGEFALIAASERVEREEQLELTVQELIVRECFEDLQGELTNEYLEQVLNPILQPIPNPIGCSERYKKLTLPVEVQESLKTAGKWPRVYGPVKSSPHSIHRLRWSACLSAALQQIISFLRRFTRMYWSEGLGGGQNAEQSIKSVAI
ncbi:hypothetical protein EDB81DRAFT_763346 [Dactylonectria macrodidyma]|uniref:Uncharacterized protein n=1 Tax=Dactylonectria macrodidyma TaxID=307937 RepID=A0A9P9E6J0_9HYPO|nr:hypothetical protein EDB81DRAFT_763346 [Dactylonectria macrodidyma]